MNVKVFHWRYEDGWRDRSVFLRANNPTLEEREYLDDIEGWHCHVYTDNDREFQRWMHKNMKGKYECSLKYNSGNPMFLIIIKDGQDATLFKLTWV